MIKVRATSAYEQNGVLDNELKIIPKKGYEFEVTEDRFNTLNGNNNHKLIFVEKVVKEKPKGSE